MKTLETVAIEYLEDTYEYKTRIHSSDTIMILNEMKQSFKSGFYVTKALIDKRATENATLQEILWELQELMEQDIKSIDKTKNIMYINNQLKELN